jgi:hypothetical protein
MGVVRRKGIVYVGLDALTDTTVASAVGNYMFADMVSVAGHIYKHVVGTNHEEGYGQRCSSQSIPTISLHADEFNELIGDEFVPLLNKAGGAGFQVTAYTQTWSDVEARIDNRAKAGEVAGNFNTMLMLRVKELDHVARYDLTMPQIKGVFCSQKAATPWAQAMNFPCSHRGPSLDLLTEVLGIEALRTQGDGIHGAAIDSR